jgi:hypothetical protein
MQTFEILSRFTGKVLASIAAETLSEAIVKAVKSRANLSGANLSGANLSGANLSGANLSGANLSRANLYGADLYGADLSGANLYGADLYGADLYGADLYGADLSGANLSGADLYGADLYGADVSGANLSGANLKELKNAELVLARTLIVPESGQFTGWKKCENNVIVRVMIGKNARRSNATGRKCRAEYVKVLEVFGAEFGVSSHDNKTKYRVGQIVRCDKWESDRWQECAGGIHFFLTRIEAENYS